ncbi:MAG: hypothetical protein KC620_20210, partial [Myxococcales bacterium]|nr:hypothetical protein [Myxococcales bacterium]
MARPGLVLLVVLGATAGMAWLFLTRPIEPPSTPAPAVTTREYAGSTACAGCHADQAKLHAGSHHALAERAPGADEAAAFAVAPGLMTAAG